MWFGTRRNKHEMPRMNRGASHSEAVSLGHRARGRALAINRCLYRLLVSVSHT